MIKKFTVILAIVVFAGSAAAVHALSMTFVTPTGSVGANELIDVWVRFATDDTPLSFDSTDPDGDTTYGNLEDFGYTPTGVFTQASTTAAYLCSGSFTAGGGGACTPGDNYTFDFNYGANSFLFLDNYFLAANSSQDFLFGTYTPVAGGAAPGTYDFFGAFFSINFSGEGTFDLAETCPSQSCSFERTVVPLPAAAWLFGSALFGLVGLVSRKKP